MLGAMALGLRAWLSFVLLGACDPVSGLLVRERQRLVDAGTTKLDGSLPEPMPDAALDLPDANLPDASDGMDAASALDAGSDASADAGPRDPGSMLATAQLDYYYAAREADYAGTSVNLSTTSCAALDTTNKGFADALCIEGTGITGDGRVLRFDDLCTCGYTCPTAVEACFRELDASSFPFGQGSSGRALLPLRSVAVDPSQALAGKVLYLPWLDGLTIEAGPGIAAFTHDGCVRADDGAVFSSGVGLRLFTGDQAHYVTLSGVLPSTIQVNEDAPHCLLVFP